MNATANKWPPPGGISTKLYRCGTCTAEFQTQTNHWGDIYTCPKCKSTSRSICIEPPPPGYVRPSKPTLHTRIHYYNLDTREPDQAKAYAALREKLTQSQGKCFNAYGHVKEFEAERGTSDLALRIELEIDQLFGNQWNSTTSLVFDWHESIWEDNKSLKSGHWLEITDEMRALRHNTTACGYCGHQQKPYAPFHTGCLADPYLKTEQLHLLRMRRIDDVTEREPLTDQEKAQLMPLYVERQTSRAVERRERQRKEIRATYDKQIAAATQERDGMSWLWDHGIDVEQVIYYAHTGKFGFGWRSPLAQEVKAELTERLAAFPFPYEFR